MTTEERSFVILKYVKKVPIMAGCSKCSLKFLAPTAYQGDSVGSEEYLRGKFERHKCGEEKPRRRS